MGGRNRPARLGRRNRRTDQSGSRPNYCWPTCRWKPSAQGRRRYLRARLLADERCVAACDHVRWAPDHSCRSVDRRRLSSLVRNKVAACTMHMIARRSSYSRGENKRRIHGHSTRSAACIRLHRSCKTRCSSWAPFMRRPAGGRGVACLQAALDGAADDDHRARALWRLAQRVTSRGSCLGGPRLLSRLDGAIPQIRFRRAIATEPSASWSRPSWPARPNASLVADHPQPAGALPLVRRWQ